MKRSVIVGVATAGLLAACSVGTAPNSTAEPSIVGDTSAADATRQQVANGASNSIDIRVGERTVVGTVIDTPAGRALLAQLPLTLNLSDHGSVEKTGPLPAGLSTDGAPASADPNPGDIGYYAPGNDFVLYYGDQSEFPGIVIIGRMDETGSETVGSVEGDVTVTVSRSDRAPS